MAGKYENYNSLVEEFNKKHGVKFSFERYETKLKQTIHMRSTFTTEGRISAEDFSYRTVAKDLFRESVESMIAKKINSADHAAFLNDFDKLMDSYREYCEKAGEDKPSKNGGWKNDAESIDDLAGKINNIPADKSDFIKDNYIKRSIRLRDMRADLESMEKDGKDATVEELSRAIVYKRALEKAIKERTFGWRAIHWFQGPAEKRDLELIKRFLGKYEHSKYYPTAEKLADENAIGEVKSKIDAAKEEIKTRELVKPRRLTDRKQASERWTNDKVTDHVLNQIRNITKDVSTAGAAKDGIIRVIIQKGKENVRNMWLEFEKATTPETKENAIIKHSQAIFNTNHTWLKGLGFKDESIMVANQRITNIMLRQYSPATSDRAYDKFLDNYLISDEKFMEGFLRNQLGMSEINKDELKDLINEFKAELTDKQTDKQKVNIPDTDINGKSVETSEKHIDVPTVESLAKTH